MKVLIIRSYPSFVNLNSNLYNQQEIGLAKAMSCLGHEIGIVYYGDDKHYDDVYEVNNCRIMIYYRKAKVFLKRVAFYEEFDDLKSKYDLLILNEYDQIESFKTLCKYHNKAVIYHGPYYSKFNTRYNIYNKIFDFLFLKKIISLSPLIYTKSELAKKFLESKKLIVNEAVGVGLDENQLINLNQEIINKDSNVINLLYIGKIEPRRNPSFLLEVLSKLIYKNGNKYHLTIIGSGDDVYIKNLFEKSEELNIKDFITYIPKLKQDQLYMYYKQANFFLLPTSYEIWGMVIMESMKFDVPIITTYNGGSSSLIYSGINGEIIDLDVNKWVSAIETTRYDVSKLHEYNKRIIDEKCNWNYIAKCIITDFIEVRN